MFNEPLDTFSVIDVLSLSPIYIPEISPPDEENPVVQVMSNLHRLFGTFDIMSLVIMFLPPKDKIQCCFLIYKPLQLHIEKRMLPPQEHSKFSLEVFQQVLQVRSEGHERYLQRKIQERKELREREIQAGKELQERVKILYTDFQIPDNAQSQRQRHPTYRLKPKISMQERFMKCSDSCCNCCEHFWCCCCEKSDACCACSAISGIFTGTIAIFICIGLIFLLMISGGIIAIVIPSYLSLNKCEKYIEDVNAYNSAFVTCGYDGLYSVKFTTCYSTGKTTSCFSHLYEYDCFLGNSSIPFSNSSWIDSSHYGRDLIGQIIPNQGNEIYHPDSVILTISCSIFEKCSDRKLKEITKYNKLLETYDLFIEKCGNETMTVH